MFAYHRAWPARRGPSSGGRLLLAPASGLRRGQPAARLRNVASLSNAEWIYWRGKMRATRHRDIAAFAHQVWPARAGALALIRREVRRWLGPLELTPDAEADLVLAVSEAAANVIDHAYRTRTDRAVVEVFLWTESGALLVEVVDHGQWRHPGPQATGRGRGIEIMRRLVDAVLIHHDTRGTRVLLRHLLPGPAPTVPPARAAPTAEAP